MQVKLIRTRQELDVALVRLQQLMGGDLAPGSEDMEEFDLLVLVIQDYESKTVPPPGPVDPIDVLVFYMEQNNLAQKDLVPYIGSKSKVSEVLARKRQLSLPMIRALSDGLHIPTQLLVPKYDLCAA